MVKQLSACTTMLVGKKASMDGSTMIARNDDTFFAVAPHNFDFHPAETGKKGRVVKSWLNGFEEEIPEDNYSWQGVPNVDYKNKGYYDESGINGKNVAMSGTESTYGNERALAYDPLVKDGLDEDCIVRMVLPFIDSAQAGVQRLGELIKKHGSPAGNSVLFSDKDDIWYMEIVTGHHWVAQRIPDDSYAITGNRVAITQVDFNDPKNFMWSEGIQEFVEQYHLNTDQTGFNFRHIFGTSNLKDRHYNTPRQWYGQKLFNPELDQDPEDTELPFVMKTDHKFSVDDIEEFLGSHYNETEFDPLGHGSEADKKRYRPIGLNRTQNAHVLQIRNDVPEEYAAIMWLCIGYPTFTPFIPFYTNMNDTEESFKNLTTEFDMNKAYWMYKALSVQVESNYSAYIQDNIDYLISCRQELRASVAKTDSEAKNYSGDELTEFLTKQNQALVASMRTKAMKFMDSLYVKGIGLSKLTFNMDENL
ncbi:C69 family dipeptidase [Lactobacillus sp. YT155]|uniref:C69 family dipeptidase n=1 Tax=Lactobacillus sp. YT155 TaxID=3060955 RepID=UPI00265DAA4A|nr:C69 family dipeptidase [Lactobacillus sp. YT155]MDO1605787.1 C69 family dipeptidase [Lactobacillus sp. YT155]